MTFKYISVISYHKSIFFFFFFLDFHYFQWFPIRIFNVLYKKYNVSLNLRHYNKYCINITLFKAAVRNFFLFKIYKINIISEYIMNPFSKPCSWLVLNHYGTPIISVYISTILDWFRQVPLRSRPVPAWYK